MFRKTSNGVSGENKPRRNRGCLWTIIICLVAYVGLSFLFGLMLGSLGSSNATLEDNTVYVLKMEGEVVEQGSEDDPFAGLFGEMPYYSQPQEVGLDVLKRNITFAKEDKRVKAILLRGGNFQIGQASAKALRDALLDFKSSGKAVYAYADTYTQTNYYIASVADRLMLNPIGEIDWKGLSAQKMYYKRLLDKIGVDMQVIKVGTFKSAVEPFILTSMSEADKEQTRLYINDIWKVMSEGVAQSRGLTVEQLNNYADLYIGLCDAGDYLKMNLVDTLVYADRLDTLLETLTGIDDLNTITTSELATVKRTEHKAKDKVAILYAEGEINDEGKDGIIGKKMVKELKDISKDDDVKALVFRVNSPGGSAFASEQIWHAVQIVKESGKKVVVSMGDYAASGGYYISCGADYIYAEPNTITGSIGIFGLIPSYGKLLKNVGLDIDGISTHRHSGLSYDIVYRGMNEEQRGMMQKMVERGYDLFTSRCAEGRGKTQDEIKAIAEGRVWTGKTALEIGLVDELGGIDEALLKAVDMAELTDYEVVYYPEKKDFLTELLEQLENTTPEEKLVAKMRRLCEQPRVMTLFNAPVIE